jgi:hypothetical protein
MFVSSDKNTGGHNMDYRDLNPYITSWSGQCLAKSVSLFPFDRPQSESFFEFIAPDGITRFLALFGGGGENEEFILSTRRYLIEAPEDCLMRKAYAMGDIDWEDFWHHKGWLIELHKPNIMVNFAHVRYVHPNDISQDAKETIRELNDRSPLLLKYDSLCRRAEWECRFEKKKGPAHFELEKFEREYCQYIQVKSA